MDVRNLLIAIAFCAAMAVLVAILASMALRGTLEETFEKRSNLYPS